MNLKIRQLEDAIIELVNSYDLPIEVKRLVLSDVLNISMRQSDKEVAQEIKQNAESTSEYQLGE